MEKFPKTVSTENASGKTGGTAAESLPAVTDGGRKEALAGARGSSGSARASVPLFGGHRGGKKRADGLKPGSHEAEEADRKRDAIRKRMERREAAALRQPPPLPSASESAARAPMATPIPVTGLPDSATPPQTFEPLQVQWSGKDVEKITREFIELTEELFNKSILTRCRKAKLPADVVREIEKDAEWSRRAKDMLQEGGSELVAMALNKSGIPPQYRPFIMMAVGCLEIGVNHMKIIKRLDALIAQQKTAAQTT